MGEIRPQAENVGSVPRITDRHRAEGSPCRLQDHQILGSARKVPVSGIFPCEAVVKTSRSCGFARVVCRGLRYSQCLRLMQYLHPREPWGLVRVKSIGNCRLTSHLPGAGCVSDRFVLVPTNARIK